MKRILFIATLLFTQINLSFAQPTTLTIPGSTSGGLSYGAGDVVTFSVRNRNPIDILITEIKSHHYQSSGSAYYNMYYSTVPSQVTTNAVADVTGAGWTYFGQSNTVSSPNGIKTFFNNIALLVPANTTMRIALTWSTATANGSRVFQGNNTLSSGNTASGNGVDLLTASNGISNSLRGQYPNPTQTYNWIGAITFEPAAVPCDDTIEYSVVRGPIDVCPKRPFGVNVALQNGLLISGMSYQWQKSLDGVTWANFIGTANPNKGGEIIDSIIVPTWYRAKVTCTTNNKTYTTPAHRVGIKPFYYCYCESEVTDDAGADIGNLKVINQTSGDTVVNTVPLATAFETPLYNNKDANKVYTSYQDSVSWPCLYRDTSYKFLVTQVHSTPNLKSTVAHVFIDLNRDGIYAPGERVFIKAIDGTSNPAEIAEVDYKIPSNATVGLTGMRVVISEDTVKLDPCDTLSGEGEVEDYIVEICHRPCDGPVTAGIVSSTDTSMCNNYEYTLTDTTYQKNRSGYSWAWEVSGDNINWFNIPGSTGKDTLQRVFGGQPLYYRMYTVCPSTRDTTYSPATLINNKPGYKCYCYSKATGGKTYDSSDIGGVTFGPISIYDGGPHLLNPMAVLPRTDHTDDTPAELFIDSAYSFYVYHTMRAVEHGDAKVTIFIDFDNDHEYDIPNERVFTGFTSIGNHTLIDSVIIPKTVIADVPTGVRVILNNDVGPNAPSDDACGGYTSGETEDFMVIFRNKIPESVGQIQGLSGFGLYPNPTQGIFNVQFNSTNTIDDVNLVITNITGQTIFEQAYDVKAGSFNKSINLSSQPAGVYFVELQADGNKLVRKLVIQ